VEDWGWRRWRSAQRENSFPHQGNSQVPGTGLWTGNGRSAIGKRRLRSTYRNAPIRTVWNSRKH